MRACLPMLVVAVAALATVARASDVPASKDKAGASACAAGSVPGVGALGGPGVGTGAQSATGTVSPAAAATGGGTTAGRAWAVEGGYEFRALVRQTDLEGAGATRLLNSVSAAGSYDLTKSDRVTVRLGAYTHYISDPGESGLRASDLVVSYSRKFALPADVSLRATVSATAPLSFASYKMTLVSAPSLGVRAYRKFGPFDVGLRTYGYLFLPVYAAPSGDPNPKTSLGGTVDVSWTAPFHPALSFGADLSTEYVWFYNVGGNDPNAARYGVVQDSQFSAQPVQQSYGGELFARYQLPKWSGVESDAVLAYAQGDPTMGYGSVLHDGVLHLYGFWRLTSEVYVAVSAKY